eukprot:g33162.t1
MEGKYSHLVETITVNTFFPVLTGAACLAELVVDALGRPLRRARLQSAACTLESEEESEAESGSESPNPSSARAVDADASIESPPTSQTDDDTDEDMYYENAWYDQRLDGVGVGDGPGMHMPASQESAQDGHGLQALLFDDGGKLTLGAVLDMLTEVASFHHASRDLMQAVVDIINLVAMDGGAPAPVLPSWESHDKRMRRSTQHVAKKYFICPYNCTSGCWPWTGRPPRRCTTCRKRIIVEPENVKQYILHHFGVEASLDAVLSHPDARKYVPTNGPPHVPHELKDSPARREFVRRPDVLTLGSFFDGVPCFRLTNTTYSVHLVTLEVMNLPFFLRLDPRFQIFTDIIPGPSKPKVLKKWLIPLLKDLQGGAYNLLFTAADYIAQVQLLCHKQLGYHGLQEDCIVQSVEDALHLVEGCIYRHLFRLLKGHVEIRKHGTFSHHSAVNGYLMGSSKGKKKEYVVLLCTIFCLIAAPVVTPALVTTLTQLERNFQTLHRQLMSPVSSPLQFHRLSHMVQCLKKFGPVFIYWTFRSERTKGQAVKRLNRRSDVEDCLQEVVMKGLLARHILGTITMAQDVLVQIQTTRSGRIRADAGDVEDQAPSSHREKHMSRLAAAMMLRRERRGCRLNLVKFPNGTPLTIASKRRLEPMETAQIRPLLQACEKPWLPQEEKTWAGDVVTQFVCGGRRFVCELDLSPRKKQDISASFVQLENEQYCLVHYGLQLEQLPQSRAPKHLERGRFCCELHLVQLKYVRNLGDTAQPEFQIRGHTFKFWPDIWPPRQKLGLHCVPKFGLGCFPKQNSTEIEKSQSDEVNLLLMLVRYLYACVSTGNTKDLKKSQLDIAEDQFVLAAEPDAEKAAVLLKNSSSSTLKTVLRAGYAKIERARVSTTDVVDKLRAHRAKNIIWRGGPADGWKVDCPETSTTIYGKNSKEEELMQRKASLHSKMQTAGQNCKNLLVAIVALLAQEKKEKKKKNLRSLQKNGHRSWR